MRARYPSPHNPRYSYIEIDVAKEIMPYQFPILLLTDNGAKFIGNGTVCKIDDEVGVFTAWHVIEDLNQQPTLLTTDINGYFIECSVSYPSKELEKTCKILDLGFLKIDETFITNDLQKKYINLSEMEKTYLAEPYKHRTTKGKLHAYQATPIEGTVMKILNNERFMSPEKAGCYFCGPNYIYFEHNGLIRDTLKTSVERNGIDKDHIPENFAGSSGTGLFTIQGINKIKSQIFDIHALFLVGICSLSKQADQQTCTDDLIFSGPAAIYESFIPAYRVTLKAS